MTFHYSATSEQYYNSKKINEDVILSHSVIITNWTQRSKIKSSGKMYYLCSN